MKYTIKKGWHYSWPLCKCDLDIIGPVTHQRAIVDVTFNETNVYDFGGSPKQYDTNKLFGYSQGHHHTNSVRAGWCWDPRDERIHLIYYAYENGANIVDGLYKDVCSIPLNESVKIGLLTERTSPASVLDHMYVYTADGSETIASYKRERAVSDSWRLGYYMTPYFGGTMTAPHDMYIDMTWL